MSKDMYSRNVIGWIIGTVLSLYITAYTLPDAMVALTNTSGGVNSSWYGVPIPVVTLATTVLAIIVILSIAIKFMPKEIKTSVGL